MRLHPLLRSLARTPLLTGMAVLTLAIGIGANTAIFSVVEGVLLKPLPYPRSEALVTLDHAAPGLDLAHAGAAPFQYFTYREEGRAFEDVALWNTGAVNVTGLAEPEEVPALLVTDGVLPILGVQPMLGRLFARDDDVAGAPPTVVLTAGYWRSKFGADPSAIGRALTIDGRPRVVIGVLPDTFRFLDRAVSIVVPLQLDRSRVFLGQFSFSAIARLKSGVTIEQASADIARMIPISLKRFPPFPGLGVRIFEEARLTPDVRSVRDHLVGDVHSVLWLLMGSIGIVLLVACANVANLLLVRAGSRQQELAIRAALGASSRRIARELLMESLTLGLLGGLAGLALAFGALRMLVALAPTNLPRLDDITLDVPVLVFTLALSVVAGLLFGAIPALKYSGAGLAAALRAGGRTVSAGRDRHRARNVLVVAQVALAVILLVASGLMARTFQALRDVHPGFARPEEVQTLRLTIPNSLVAEETAVARMHQALADRIAAVPGVTSVALASTVTMSGEGWHDPLYADTHSSSQSEVPPIRFFKFVSPGYTKTMGGSLVAGRDFTWADIFELRPVAMVSENLAREWWGHPAAAIGKRIRPYAKGVWREVVGVVSDMRDDGVHQKAPATAYWPLLMADFSPNPNDNPQFVQRGASYLIRSRRTGGVGFVNELRHAVWSVNPNLPLARVRTLREIYDASLARTSFALVMIGLAGGMALLLGVAGIYGVVAFSVSERRREIGVRMALGAHARSVIGLFVLHGLTIVSVGLALGLMAAAATTRLMSSLLFDVSPVDPLTYATAALALLAAAALACYVPALRAAFVDPIEALRSE